MFRSGWQSMKDSGSDTGYQRSSWHNHIGHMLNNHQYSGDVQNWLSLYLTCNAIISTVRVYRTGYLSPEQWSVTQFQGKQSPSSSHLPSKPSSSFWIKMLASAKTQEQIQKTRKTLKSKRMTPVVSWLQMHWVMLIKYKKFKVHSLSLVHYKEQN